MRARRRWKPRLPMRKLLRPARRNAAMGMRARLMMWSLGLPSWRRLLLVLTRRPRSLRRTAILALVAAVLLVVYPWLAQPWILPHYQYAHERGLSLNVYDGAFRWLGPLPNVLEPDVTYGSFPSMDHLAVAPDSVPAAWWRVLKALEDCHMGSWRSVYGVDIGGVVRALTVDPFLRRRSTGASSLAMQLVRVLDHRTVGRGEGRLAKIKRKLQELRAAPVLWAHLGEEGLKAWLATDAPLAIGRRGTGFGLPVYGIELTSRILFGHGAADCDLVECALLAAAHKSPFVLQPNQHGWEVSRPSFDRAVRRARRGIRLAYGAEHPLTVQACQVLEDMDPPAVRVPPDFYQMVERDSLVRFRQLASPSRRAPVLAHRVMEAVRAQLRLQFGGCWKDSVSGGIRLSVDAVQNHAFCVAVDDVLQDLEKSLGSQLSMPLRGEGDNQLHAGVTIAVADGFGAIRLLYTNDVHCPYFSCTPGSEPSEDVRIRMGSVGKVPLALLFGSLGHEPETMYCNLAVPGVHNNGHLPGVSDCRQAGAWLPAKHVFSRSWNCPLFWALRNVSNEALGRLAEDFGIELCESAPPKSSFVLGLGTSTLPRMHLWMHEILSVLANPNDTTAGSIQLVYRYRGSGPAAKWEPIGHPLFDPRIRHYLQDEQSRAFVQGVLSAPLGPGGTLMRLCDWVPEKRDRIILHVAKSGTVELPEDMVGGLLVSGGLLIDASQPWNSQWTYLVGVSTPDPRQPLGDQRLAAGDVARLVRVALEFLPWERARGADIAEVDNEHGG